MEKVFNMCLEKGISINFEKSSFLREEVNYVGLTITKNYYYPQIDKKSLQLLPAKP